MKFSKDQLTTAATRLLNAGGATQTDSEKVAERLVNGNLVGHDSHGVIRLCQYVDQLRDGTIKTGVELETVADFGAISIFDAGLGFGQVMAERGCREGLDKASSHGISMIGMRNVAHVGRLGDWAELAADEGFVSIHFVNSPAKPGVVPFGGRERRMATNPICVGIPVNGQDSLIVDMTTSSVAEGKLRVARASDRPIPDGWIVDKNGKVSNDPNDYYEGGAILPMGGHKGYALSLVVDLFAGALTGGGTTSPDDAVNRNSMMSIFIDPRSYDRDDTMSRIASSYLDWVRTCRAADGNGVVLIPGDPERTTKLERVRAGIELPDGVWAQIVETANAVGLSQQQLLE